VAEGAQRRGDLAVALEQADKGIRFCGNLHRSDWLLKFQLLKAEILLSQSRAAEAKPLLETAGTTISQSPSSKARWLSDLAELKRQAGAVDEFRNLLSQSQDLASKEGDSALLSWIEQRRGVYLNDFTESDSALHHALDLARHLGDEYLISGALNGLGYIRLTHSRYDDAISYFEAADKAAQKIPSKVRHEKCLGNLGWCYFRLGQQQRALELFSTAEPLAAEAQMLDDHHRWLANMGSVYYVRENYDKAIAYYLRASDIALRIPNRVYAATYLNNIARVYIDQSKWDAAEKYSRLAVETLQGVTEGGRVEAYSRLNAGFIAAARGQPASAEAEFRRALEIAAREEVPNVLWEAHSGLAALYRSQNSLAGAGGEYAAAMSVQDHEWQALSRDESKITFREYQAGVYQEYVGFLSERDQREKALEVAESSRARLMRQKLESGSFVLPRFRAEQAVRLARGTGTVLLSYWLAPERSYVWAVTAKGVSQFVLPGEKEIDALVERHQRAIQDLQDPLADGQTAASELYRMLIGPVESLAHSGATVIIVPDGRLHELNFETLVVGGPKPHYWIEDVTVALTPSFTVLQLRKSAPASEPKLLIFGDPLPAAAEFPPLPHLKTEVREIAAGFPEARRALYTGEQAYAEHFRETDPRAFTAIHFAAHAAANEESPLNSAIILSPHDGRYKLYAREVADLRLEPELVTISACRSAGSKAYSGEGLVGFAWAFLEAGAHNVVAGIWNVDDAAAPLIMEELYKRWRDGDSPAAALRGAKLKLMRSGGAFRKPYYWGPFEVFTR